LCSRVRPNLQVLPPAQYDDKLQNCCTPEWCKFHSTKKVSSLSNLETTHIQHLFNCKIVSHATLGCLPVMQPTASQAQHLLGMQVQVCECKSLQVYSAKLQYKHTCRKLALYCQALIQKLMVPCWIQDVEAAKFSSLYLLWTAVLGMLGKSPHVTLLSEDTPRPSLMHHRLHLSKAGVAAALA
jgi:hypothetical protein